MAADFPTLLNMAATAHGHLCPGMVLGVRMGILGLAMLGYDAPLDDRSIKNVVVFIEIDRCAADALGTTTGVKLGRRSLKFMDYGLMAATFLHLPDNRAIRISVGENCREKAREMFPDVPDKYARELKAYQVLAASDLFDVEEVRVDLDPMDMPGHGAPKAYCDDCGTVIRHGRYVELNGRKVCRVCAGDAYFERVAPIGDIDRLDPVVVKGE
jgi:formylmethanofuran dehydrogenase subunit E